METVAQVAAEIRAEVEQFSTASLCDILKGYGMAISGMTRKEMIDEIVDLEVYAFTH